MDAFICQNIGQVDDGVKVVRCRNTDGTFYFKATTVITHVLGSDLGPGAPTLEGFGPTEAVARARLTEELKKFNDSLWY